MMLMSKILSKATAAAVILACAGSCGTLGEVVKDCSMAIAGDVAHDVAAAIQIADYSAMAAALEALAVKDGLAVIKCALEALLHPGPSAPGVAASSPLPSDQAERVTRFIREH